MGVSGQEGDNDKAIIIFTIPTCMVLALINNNYYCSYRE